MRNIVIYGAGGFGKEVACLINRINENEPIWRLVGFIDDDPAKKKEMVSHFAPCLGGIDVLNAYPDEIAVALAIGNSVIAKKIFEKIHNEKVTFPNLIDNSFYLVDPESFIIGKGNIIMGPGAVSCDVSVGDFNVMNGSVVLGHDVSIGSFNTLMPAVRVSGEVTVGDCNFFGVGSIVLQQIVIGDNVRLGAGSVLMTKPGSGNLYIGVPAKKIDL